VVEAGAKQFAKRGGERYHIGMAAERKARRKRAPNAISPDELLRELPGSRLVAHDAGTFIFREGSKGANCYFITRGRLRIFKRSLKGEDVPVALVKPGEFLGEMSMLSGERRSASALALTRVKAISIDHADFVSLLKEQNPFATRMLLQFGTLLASRCHHLLRLIARQPDIVPLDVKKVTPLDIRAVLDHVHTLWAV
jgi:CRP-like cAMP-binding protein